MGNTPNVRAKNKKLLDKNITVFVTSFWQSSFFYIKHKRNKPQN